MPAGATTISVLDGGAVSRTMTVWSSTGAVTGLLSPLQGLLGADGATIASASNGLPFTPTGNLTVVGTGTFATQAAQSGTWNITNISGTISLPTGAATASNITTAFGTASLFSTVGAGAAPTNALAIAGQYNSTPITLTNTQSSAAQLDANGYLKVNVAAGGAAGGTSSNFAAAFPSAGTAIGAKAGANMVNLTADGSGNLNVNVAAGSAAGTAATHAQTAALAASLVVKASAGTLYGLEVSADSTLTGAAFWVMIFDATSAPADGAVTPTKVYAAPSGTLQWGSGFGPFGVAFTTGISVAISTTGPFTKTSAGNHAFIGGDFI